MPLESFPYSSPSENAVFYDDPNTQYASLPEHDLDQSPSWCWQLSCWLKMLYGQVYSVLNTGKL